MNKNVISVIDGAAGSCGKAKVVGEIATDKRINLGAAITNCMPNAGHTFVDENGNATVFRNIPVSIINPNTELFIGPGSAIDMDVFNNEYEKAKKFLNNRKIYIHERVPIITELHKEYERNNIKSGSTFKGGGAALAAKVLRDKNQQFFEKHEGVVVLNSNDWIEKIHSHVNNPNEYVMLEGSQGCDLDIDHSGNYPNTTSRNVSTTQLLSYSGISASRLLQTIMVIRPFPIRINNITNDGRYINTGKYGTGVELTWTDVNLGALNGVYPYRGNCPYEVFYEYAYHASSILEENKDKILSMYLSLPREYKMQLFEGEYKEKLDYEFELNLALEIERLYWKSLNIRTYSSVVIKRINNNGRVFDNADYIITDLSEMTSVTKKERRIFDLDIEKLKNNILINEPYGLYLNFSEHLDYNLTSKVGNYDDIKKDYSINKDNIDRYIEWLESECDTSILALGTGKKNNERILKKELIKGL